MLAPFSLPREEVEMHRDLTTVTGTFGKIADLSERLSRSIFSAVLAAFEAYGTALCGHVPTTCPIEQTPRSAEKKQGTSVLSEPQTRTFAIERSRSSRKLSAVPQCQL